MILRHWEERIDHGGWMEEEEEEEETCRPEASTRSKVLDATKGIFSTFWHLHCRKGSLPCYQRSVLHSNPLRRGFRIRSIEHQLPIFPAVF